MDCGTSQHVHFPTAAASRVEVDVPAAADSVAMLPPFILVGNTTYTTLHRPFLHLSKATHQIGQL